MSVYSIQKTEGDTVKIPSDVLSTLNVRSGEYLVFQGNRAKKEIIVRPLISSLVKAAEMKLMIKNVPGTNAKVDTVLGDLGINIVFGRGGQVDEGIYISVKLLDFSNARVSVKEVQREIEKIDEVIDLIVEEI
ncbi:MAG TPA: hypothetical protein PK718_00555 [Candidatus Methanofastidiosa archaeon]|nr:hypothetical protein [Candidatus Methanofastidiosa archaeon]